MSLSDGSPTDSGCARVPTCITGMTRSQPLFVNSKTGADSNQRNHCAIRVFGVWTFLKVAIFLQHMCCSLIGNLTEEQANTSIESAPTDRDTDQKGQKKTGSRLCFFAWPGAGESFSFGVLKEPVELQLGYCTGEKDFSVL
jgi:hypothetical protein